MKNAKMTIKGNKLILEVDLTQDAGISQSGKSVNVAASEGVFEKIDGSNLYIKLNINRKVNTDMLGNKLPDPEPVTAE